jgi:hypothetical protein
MHNIPTGDHVLTGLISSQRGCYFVERGAGLGGVCALIDNMAQGRGLASFTCSLLLALIGSFSPRKEYLGDVAFTVCSEIGAVGG